MGVAISTLSSLRIQTLWQTVSSGCPELRRSPEKLAGAGGSTPKPRPWTRPSLLHTPPSQQLRGWVSKVLGWAFPSLFSPTVITDEEDESLTGGDVNNGIGNHEIEERIKNQVFTRDQSDRFIELLRSRTTGLPDDSECAEIEEMIKHKTFTTDESAHVIELLRSRTTNVSDDGSGHDAGSTLTAKKDRLSQNVSKTAAKEDSDNNQTKLRNMEALRSRAHEVSSSPIGIAKAYMEGLKSELANIERKPIKSCSFLKKRLTEEYSMNHSKPVFPMPKRSYALNDSLAQINPIWHAHQLSRLRKISERSNPFCASTCAPSVMESLHDFRGAISAYQNAQQWSSKGSFRNFSYISKDDDMFRSPVGTVRPQSSRMGQRTPEHLDRSVNPKGKSQDQATTFSEPIPLKFATMATSVGGGSSYVPALQPTLSDYATLFMDNQGRKHDSPEQYASSPSTRKFENMESNVRPQTTKVAPDMKMSDDLKTSSLGGRDMGTHECEDQEKNFSLPSEDMGCIVHLTAEMAPQELDSLLLGGQEKDPDTQISDETHLTNDPEENFSLPSEEMGCIVHLTAEMAPQELDGLLLGGQEGPDTQISDKAHLTNDPEENFSLPSEDMGCIFHLTAEMAPQELDSLLLGGQEKGLDTQISDETHLTNDPEEASSCPSTNLDECTYMSRKLLEDFIHETTQMAQKMLEDIIQFDEISQEQELAFSKRSEKEITDDHKICNLNDWQLGTQVSGIPDKDFPSRSKSGDVDLTLENPNSAQKSLQHFDPSVSGNNVPQVPGLSFEMPKVRQKSAIKVRRLTHKMQIHGQLPYCGQLPY